jgi:hypothetical protein
MVIAMATLKAMAFLDLSLFLSRCCHSMSQPAGDIAHSICYA